MERLRRVPAWGWALLFSVLLCLPRLGSFGLWEPWELNVAERARRMADGGLSASVIFDALARGELVPVLQAIGVAMFGTTELGVRLFGALAGVGALMSVYWAAVGLFRRRAALLAVLALGTMPLFALSSRQVTSDMPLVAALTIAIGALGRWAWPADGRRRWSHLAIGVLALVLGYAAGGALIGIALPCLALTAAVAVCRTLPVRGAIASDGGAVSTAAAPAKGVAVAGVDVAPATAPAPADVALADVAAPLARESPNDGTDVLTAPGVGPDVVAGQSFGASLRKPFATIAVLAGVALLGLFILVPAFTQLMAGHYSALIGGTPHGGAPTVTYDVLIRQLGFGLFPWSALAFFALGRPLIRLDDAGDGSRTSSRLAFAQTMLLLFAGFGLALSTVQALLLGEARFVALGAIALAIGAFLDEALEGNRSEPVAGLLIATGTMVVARDFFLTPEELASVHLFGEKVKWPPTVSIGTAVLGFGLLTALGVYTGLATRGRALGRIPGRDLSGSWAWQRRLEPKIVVAGRYGLQVAVGATVVFGFWLTQVLVPTLSTHFSFKPIIETFVKYAKHGEKFGRYRIEGKGTGFYSGLTMIDLPSQDTVIAFLRQPERVFVLSSADELAALDSALKQGQVPYFAIDASSSRFLLLSNRLETGERDQNPLKHDVWMAPTNPAQNGGQWNASEHPPWNWRVPLSATFADAIEIVGAGFPESVRRPGKIPLELFFRVKARPPGGFKIFVHFDGPATPRVIGDHDPVGKAFPTTNWLPGEYVRDFYEVEVPLMTTPAGTYQIFMGFWPGGEGRRMKITQGPNDGADRLHVGTIEIK